MRAQRTTDLADTTAAGLTQSRLARRPRCEKLEKLLLQDTFDETANVVFQLDAILVVQIDHVAGGVILQMDAILHMSRQQGMVKRVFGGEERRGHVEIAVFRPVLLQVRIVDQFRG